MTNRSINFAAFAILTALWIVFIGAAVVSPGLLNTAWLGFMGLPMPLQILAGITAFPVILGLWIWGTTWPLLLRFVLVLGLAWMTVYLFYPRQPAGKPQA